MTFTTNLNDTKIVAFSMTEVVKEIQSQLSEQRVISRVSKLRRDRKLVAAPGRNNLEEQVQCLATHP